MIKLLFQHIKTVEGIQVGIIAIATLPHRPPRHGPTVTRLYGHIIKQNQLRSLRVTCTTPAPGGWGRQLTFSVLNSGKTLGLDFGNQEENTDI